MTIGNLVSHIAIFKNEVTLHIVDFFVSYSIRLYRSTNYFTNLEMLIPSHDS